MPEDTPENRIANLIEHYNNKYKDEQISYELAYKESCPDPDFDALAFEQTINGQPKEQLSLLHIVAKIGDEETARSIIAKDISIDLNVKSQPSNRTPLHYAADKGNDQIISCLIEKCNNIDEQDINGDTALHLALKNGHQHTIGKLLNHNARTDILNNDGYTPIKLAEVLNNVDALQWMSDRNPNNTGEDQQVTEQTNSLSKQMRDDIQEKVLNLDTEQFYSYFHDQELPLAETIEVIQDTLLNIYNMGLPEGLNTFEAIVKVFNNYKYLYPNQIIHDDDYSLFLADFISQAATNQDRETLNYLVDNNGFSESDDFRNALSTGFTSTFHVSTDDNQHIIQLLLDYSPFYSTINNLINSNRHNDQKQLILQDLRATLEALDLVGSELTDIIYESDSDSEQLQTIIASLPINLKNEHLERALLLAIINGRQHTLLSLMRRFDLPPDHSLQDDNVVGDDNSMNLLEIAAEYQQSEIYKELLKQATADEEFNEYLIKSALQLFPKQNKQKHVTDLLFFVTEKGFAQWTNTILGYA